MKRDRERDRDRDRTHSDRNMDRMSGGKDERIRRDSGGYNMSGHYSGSRDDDHWLSRDGRDMRDGRYNNKIIKKRYRIIIIIIILIIYYNNKISNLK